MNSALFFDDDIEFFTASKLREAAREVVSSSSLILRAADGELAAAVALHIGFWPFVREFEIAIDKRQLPRNALRDRFNGAGEGYVNRTFSNLSKAVREMREEEGSHAAHWQKDAQCLGLSVLDGSSVVTGVQALIDTAYSKDLPRFFSVLAGTEFIAEELSSLLVGKSPYLDLFSRRRWVWGEVHLAPHAEGPSHLEVDLDLARAYSSDDISAKSGVLSMVAETISLFKHAADEVEKRMGASVQNVAL